MNESSPQGPCTHMGTGISVGGYEMDVVRRGGSKFASGGGKIMKFRGMSEVFFAANLTLNHGFFTIYSSPY